MMTIGDIRAATTVITTIREDWRYDAVENAIAELASGNYTHADILQACITIAQDRRNNAPITLTIKTPEHIARAHATTHHRPIYRPGVADPTTTCDICKRTEDLCQANAGNRGSNWDHHFVSVLQADQMRAGRGIPVPDLYGMPEDA